MTLSEIKGPDGGLPTVTTEGSACASCLWEVGTDGRDSFTGLLPWWPEGPVELEGRVWRCAFEGQEDYWLGQEGKGGLVWPPREGQESSPSQ